MLLSPLKLWRLLELLRHSVAGAKSEKNRSGVAIPDFELLSIAVAPEARRNGVAKRLYDALVVYVGSQRKHGFKIVVGETLIGAHKFYLRMGAVPQARACVHADTVSVVYVQKIA
jgi:GNAT superfamily N-acetyltransferase